MRNKFNLHQSLRNLVDLSGRDSLNSVQCQSLQLTVPVVEVILHL